jgi:hypothetical protein
MTKPKPIAEVLAAVHWNERAKLEGIENWNELDGKTQALEMGCMSEVVRYIGLFGWEVYAEGTQVFVRRIEKKPDLRVVSKPLNPTDVGPQQMTYDQARQSGYEGDICGNCGSMQMVRNGSCLKCMSCGSTTGCS